MPKTVDDLYVGNHIVTPILPLACHADPLKCSEMAKKNFKRELHPMNIVAYRGIMAILMSMPFGLSNPISYMLSMKTTLIITSLPSNFDLDLVGGVKIYNMYGITARIYSTRTQMGVAPVGDNFCVCVSSDTTRIKNPQLFKQILT